MKNLYFTCIFILLIALSIRAKVASIEEDEIDIVRSIVISKGNDITPKSEEVDIDDEEYTCFTTEIDSDEEESEDVTCFTTEIDSDEEASDKSEVVDNEEETEEFTCFTTEIDSDEEASDNTEVVDDEEESEDVTCFTTEIDSDEEASDNTEVADDEEETEEFTCFTTEIDSDEETASNTEVADEEEETEEFTCFTTEIDSDEETEKPSDELTTLSNEKEEETEKVTEVPTEEKVVEQPTYYEEDEEPIDFEELLREGFDEEDIAIYKNYENLRRNVPFNGESLLDVYYDKYDTKNKKPVVIFVYGGSWVSGNKIRYTKFGVLLEQKGYVGVVPNYELFPQGTVEDMVEDVYNMINWTYENIERYGGDPNRIILTAHSAGAHVTALTIVKAALHQTNNGIQFKDLPYIEKAVLMNGPYVLDGEVVIHTVVQTVVNFFKNLFGKAKKQETKSGADTSQNANIPKFILKYFNDNKISPTNILKKVGSNTIENHFNIGVFNFFYTSEDESVPESSAKNLIKEIERTSSDAKCKYFYREGLQHATLVFGIRDGDPEYENIYLDLIKN